MTVRYVLPAWPNIYEVKSSFISGNLSGATETCMTMDFIVCMEPEMMFFAPVQS